MRREDQDKINKFSRLHQKEINLKEELKTKDVRSACPQFRLLAHISQKEKEDLDDVTNELELADDEAMIPYASTQLPSHRD